jgi:hypothetical protein
MPLQHPSYPQENALLAYTLDEMNLRLRIVGLEFFARHTPGLATAALPDYSVNRVKLLRRSPRIAVRFMDGEAVFTHVPSAPGKPLNIGGALRVAIVMYRSRKGVQRRAGFREYDRVIPVPEIFQVRCLETDELFDVGACNKHTATERQSTDPGRAVAMLARSAGEGRARG